MAVAFPGLRFSSSDADCSASRHSPSATSGFARSSCIALVRFCSATASRPPPDGPIKCGLLCQTSAYGDVAQPASIPAVLTAATSEGTGIIRVEYAFPILLNQFNLAVPQLDATSGARLLSISSF